MNLLLLSEETLDSNGNFQVTGKHAEHIFCILHAIPGNLLKIGFISGKIGKAEVLESTKKYATLHLLNADTPPPAPSNITPLIALPRPQSFKKTLHFIASSGIREAFFFHGSKTEKSYWTSSVLSPDSIKKYLLEGMEQGATTIVPEISFIKSQKELISSGILENLTRDKLPLLAHPNQAKPCPSNYRGNVSLVIGPEGGLTEEELTIFESHGFQRITCTPHILRVEFALAFFAGRLAYY